MQFVSFTKEDAYYEFVGSEGDKYVIPSTAVILVDDGSDLVSVKLIATRKTIGTVPKE